MRRPLHLKPPRFPIVLIDAALGFRLIGVARPRLQNVDGRRHGADLVLTPAMGNVQVTTTTGDGGHDVRQLNDGLRGPARHGDRDGHQGDHPNNENADCGEQPTQRHRVVLFRQAAARLETGVAQGQEILQQRRRRPTPLRAINVIRAPSARRVQNTDLEGAKPLHVALARGFQPLEHLRPHAAADHVTFDRRPAFLDAPLQGQHVAFGLRRERLPGAKRAQIQNRLLPGDLAQFGRPKGDVGVIADLGIQVIQAMTEASHRRHDPRRHLNDALKKARRRVGGPPGTIHGHPSIRQATGLVQLAVDLANLANGQRVAQGVGRHLILRSRGVCLSARLGQGVPCGRIRRNPGGQRQIDDATLKRQRLIDPRRSGQNIDHGARAGGALSRSGFLNRQPRCGHSRHSANAGQANVKKTAYLHCSITEIL